MGKYERTISKSNRWGMDLLMIFVTLGTQDKSFERLLSAIDREIEKGNIKEKVIVQAGYTKYESENMEILDLVSSDDFEEYVSKCRVLITHGGVGSILSAIQKNKIVIAAARLKKYKEHTNDHQRQIVSEFAKLGYILELKDFNKLGRLLEKADTFKPRKFVSNNKKFVNIIDGYVNEENYISWYNKLRQIIKYLFFGLLTTFVNVISFYIMDKIGLNVYVNNFIAWCLSILFAFITNKLFVFESISKNIKTVFREFCSFSSFRLLSLVIDMVGMYLCINIFSISNLFSKIIMNIIVIILNYIFSKIFVFKNKSN